MSEEEKNGVIYYRNQNQNTASCGELDDITECNEKKKVDHVFIGLWYYK